MTQPYYQGAKIAVNNLQRPFVPAWIFQQGFTARQVAVLLYVASRGECYASQASIGRALHIERGDVGKILRELVAYQWLEVLPFGYNGKRLKCHKLATKPGIRFDAPKRSHCSHLATQTNNHSSYNEHIGEAGTATATQNARQGANMQKNGSFKVKEVLEHSAATEGAAENAQKGTKEASQQSGSMMTAEKTEASVTGQSLTLKERDQIMAVIFGDFNHLRGRRPVERKAEKWA